MQGYYPNNNFANSVMTVFVNGQAGAESYPVAAGCTVMCIDFNAKKFWIKGTDANGVPQRMREFDFTEVMPPVNTQGSDMVTRAEFNNLTEKLDQLIRELGGK